MCCDGAVTSTIASPVRLWRRVPRDWHAPLIALGHVAMGVALYFSDLYAVNGTGRDVPLLWRLALLLVAAALLLWRRRAPVPALAASLIPLAIDAGLGPSIPIWIVASDLVYATARYGSRRAGRASVLIANLGSAVVVVGGSIVAGDARIGILLVGALAVFVLTPVWTAVAVRISSDAAETERARVQAVAAVADRDRVAAVTAERARLARDLHDVVAGHVSAIAIQSEAALGVAGRSPASSHAVLASIRENSLDALREMREMIGLLRGDDGSDGADPDPESVADSSDAVSAPGLAGMDRLIASAEQSGSVVHMRTGVDRALPRSVDITAYRIIQESLTNAIKHAPGQPVRLEIDLDDDTLRIVVINGVDGVSHGTEGYGVRGMCERAEALGGTVGVAENDRTWSVRATLPAQLTAR